MTINLKALRERAGLSQAALAEGTGLSQPAISRFEDNPDTVPWGEMLRLLRALGVNPAEQAEEASPPVRTGLDLGSPTAQLQRDLSLLVEFAGSAPEAMRSLPDVPTVDELMRLAGLLGRKPNVSLTGPFDGG